MRRGAAVIDIDGVLIRGTHPIEGACESLALLREHGVPHVFVTNGGGVPRPLKASQVSRIVGCNAEDIESRLISAHDPILDELKERGLLDNGGRVLVVSKSDEMSHAVAAEWGLKKYFVLEDFERHHPYLFPATDKGTVECKEEEEEDNDDLVCAVCIVATPHNWGHSLQLCCDVLRFGGRLKKNSSSSSSSSSSREIPLFVSNPDVDYRARHVENRMTTGAWLICLQSLLQHYGHVQQPVLAGKPHQPIYRKALQELKKKGWQEGDDVWCIGDNPASDIRGANAHGLKSILVLTGVASMQDEHDVAHQMVPDILTAVKEIILK